MKLVYSHRNADAHRILRERCPPLTRCGQYFRRWCLPRPESVRTHCHSDRHLTPSDTHIISGEMCKLSFKVVYHEPVTGPRSPEIVHRQSAIYNKLAPKP